jgi:hypothetical protein
LGFSIRSISLERGGDSIDLIIQDIDFEAVLFNLCVQLIESAIQFSVEHSITLQDQIEFTLALTLGTDLVVSF